MKKEMYESAEIEIIRLLTDNVILTSEYDLEEDEIPLVNP